MTRGTHGNLKIYLPHSVLRNPKIFMSIAFQDLSSSLSIAWAIFYRDFSAKYRQTFTGYLSALVPVFLTTVSFIFLKKSNVINFSESSIDYGSFVFINTIFWELFSESCQGPTREIQNNISSIIRLNFPRESLFLASFLNVIANFAVKISVAIIFAFMLDIHITWNLFYILPILFGMISLGYLIGLIVLPLSILYSDFKIVVDVILRLVFFLTPITYQINYASMGHQWIPKINILGYYFNSLKEIIFLGYPPTNLNFIYFFALISMSLLLFGWVFYRISIPILIERMPS